MADNFNSTTGAFVPTTNVWDVSQIYDVKIDSPEFRELLVRLYQNINLIALVLNIKDSGIYNTLEFVNGQTFFPNPILSSDSETNPEFRQVYRMVIDFGALPNTGAKSVAHNVPITPATTFTRIYATASDTTNFDYTQVGYGTDILIDVDATNVTITTASDRSSFNVCYVILEYLQS